MVVSGSFSGGPIDFSFIVIKINKSNKITK